MKQTGELLKKARENAKLSLSEVALSTKINPKVLAAIENGDSANLPAKTFLKGFVRSYAMFLKMDADEVIRTFNAEIAAQSAPPPTTSTPAAVAPPTETPKVSEPAPEKKQRRMGDDENYSGLRAIAVTVIVVLIGLIIGVRELIEKYQKEKVVEAVADVKVSPLPEAPKEAEPKSAEPVKAEEKVEEPPKALAEVKAAAPESAPAPTPAPAPPPTAAPAPPPVAEPAVPAKTADAKPEASKPESAVKNIKHEIILEALDKVEVKFKLHGRTKVVSLGATQVHTIFSDEPMVLDLSDGGAVNIILNGREKGVPGDLGKPKQVNIP